MQLAGFDAVLVQRATEGVPKAEVADLPLALRLTDGSGFTRWLVDS